MPTKFEAFLSDKKLDARRILAASRLLERLRPEDRALRLSRRLARKSEEGAKKKEAGAPKPRSGRPVTSRAIDAAIAGKPLKGPAKTRILRAVNQLLTQKKQEPVGLSVLFPKA